MVAKGIQQFMLGTVLNNEVEAKNTLTAIKNAGYDSIELCRFMMQPTGLIIKILTKVAGMPVGKGAKLDWHRLIKASGLSVTSLHCDLGSLEAETKNIAKEVKSFDTNTVVVTGMYRFDYGNEAQVRQLAQRLNHVGELLSKEGIYLLYHNHNCELRKVNQEKTAYDLLIEETNPEFINFEFDSYWFAEAGADALWWMKRLNKRMKMWHINDRGFRKNGPTTTPIIKMDSMELGTGNMNLDQLINQAISVDVEAIILESHKNWIDQSAIKSLELSAKWLNEKI